jgi:hypothetical protein
MANPMEVGNPEYTVTSAALQKFRSSARKGLKNWDRYYRQAYGAAVEQAVLAAQRSHSSRTGAYEPRPTCASGTWHTTGAKIEAAIRSQHNASLLAYPAKVRRKRTPVEWQSMYEESMAQSRAQTGGSQ